MVHSLADYVVKATALVAQMTLEEKALLLSGDGWWRTHRVDRLQIPSVCMTDGPHGLRKVEGEGLGLSTSVPATCFPTASALASSWDTGLIRQVGTALAEEAQAKRCADPVGPRRQHETLAFGRPQLRIFLRRPRPGGQNGSGLHRRGPKSRRRHVLKTLRGQQPGVRTHGDQFQPG